MTENIFEAKNAYQTYLKRFFIHSISKLILLPEAEVFIVIPVYAEENWLQTLQSLDNCAQSNVPICVIPVINCKATDSVETKQMVNQNWAESETFVFRNSNISITPIDARNLTDKQAGVGLARKIGMDAVVNSLRDYDANPWIICLDGDCLVSEKYLEAIQNQLVSSKCGVAVLEFLHPSLPSNVELMDGIQQYELYLEYYRLGLFWAGFPFYHHTVGSSMGCKAVAYARSGGMNQRKAGEDFYFLHKLFPHYEVVELNGPLVYPSARISERVPFGTGRFQKKWVESDLHKWLTYSPEIFRIMSIFLEEAIEALKSEQIESDFFSQFTGSHSVANEWIKTSNVIENLKRCKKSSQNPERQKKAFFLYFDGFEALKFVHFFQKQFDSIAVEDAVILLIPEVKNFPTIPEKVRFIRKRLSKVNSAR